MIKLFNFENFEVKVEPEALMLKPFKILADKYKKDKYKLQQVLAFIYFYSDPRSDYMYIVDKSERKESIKQGLGIDESWEPDKDVENAIEFYESFKPATALLVEDSFAAVDKLRQALRDIDFKQVDDKGKPIYPLNTMTSTIKIIPSLVKDLNEAQRVLNSDIKSSIRMRGGQEKTIFDDGINL